METVGGILFFFQSWSVKSKFWQILRRFDTENLGIQILLSLLRLFKIHIQIIGSAYHLYGKPGNSGENSNGTVHPGGNFPEKRNTFRGITFFPFLPKRLKFFVPFVWLTSARLPLEAEGEKWRSFPRRAMVFRKWYNSSQCLFSETFSNPVPFVRHFCRSFLTNGKRSGSMTVGNYSHWSILCCSHFSGLVYCCRLMKILNKFHLGAQTIIIFW